MRRIMDVTVYRLTRLILITIIFAFSSGQTISQQYLDNIFLPGEVIVKFSQQVDFTPIGKKVPLRTGIESIDQLDRITPIQEAKPLFPSALKGGLLKTVTLPSGKVVSVPALSNIYRLRISPDLDVLSFIEELKNDPAVVFAEPNYIGHASSSPNDPFFTNQWGLRKIQADSAWSLETGDSSVIIGILDTGVELFHEDLQDNIWVNQDEIPDNGFDDDGNGYIDDVYGWNFVTNSNNPGDNAGHGTHVASISAAVTNNSTGVAGVSWHSKLMSVKVLNINGQGNYSDIAEGIVYAAQNGSKVINISLGGYYPSELLETALLNAYASSILVASVGNDSRSDSYYPAAYPYVLAVAGIDSNEVLWTDSNYGPWVSISAPGVGIYSTRMNNTYGSLSGTSMAASFVSGTAALLFSQDPTLDPASVFNQILNSADDIDPYNSGYEGLLGIGRVNAYRAVSTTPLPKLEVTQTAVDDAAGGDSDGILDAGETADLTVTLYNAGKTVPDINATLFSSDTLVQISQNSSLYGTIEARNTSENKTPFTIIINADAPNDHVVTFRLALSSTSEFFDTLTFTLQTQREFNLSGLISSDLTLTRDKLYVVTSSILIDQGITLTIEPGVELKFDSGNSLQVKGTLIAQGTAQNRITFTSNQSSPNPGDWASIEFFDQCSDAVFDSIGSDSIGSENISGCILEFINIEYAGSNNSPAAIIVTNSSVFINHVNVVNCASAGICLRKSTGGTVPMTKVTNSEITNNSGTGVYCDCYQYNVSIMVDSCLISANGGDGINTGGGDHGGTHYFVFTNNKIAENNGRGIWGGSNGIQLISGNIIINNNGEGIMTRGHGPYTISNNIIKDNTGRGIHGIYTTHYITGNTIVSNGGGIAISQGGDYTIRNNYIVGNIAPNGAAFDPSGAWSSPVLLERNTIAGNVSTEAGADSTGTILTFHPEQGDPNFILNNNNIFGNLADYVIFNTRNITLSNINAENNWWGTSDENVIKDLIYDWNDDDSFGIVDIHPFLSFPNPSAPGHLYSITTTPPEPVGIELLEISLHFSKPMNVIACPSITLRDIAGTTYMVDQNAGWVDSSLFSAAININEMFIDGFYTIQVTGAVDPAGFEMPRDTTNRLLIYTAGSAARELHVSSLDGKVFLGWNQSDITNLLGYNLYRSMTSGGPYEQLNQAIITDTTFVDSIFEVSGTYYYVYTIMDANFRESGYSNKASISITTDISETEAIPTVVSLFQNYPNPFNHTTTISYNLLKSSFVKLYVYDIIGRLVETLVNEQKNAGSYTVKWNAENVASGIYFYRIDAGEFSSVKKCLIVK